MPFRFFHFLRFFRFFRSRETERAKLFHHKPVLLPQLSQESSLCLCPVVDHSVLVRTLMVYDVVHREPRKHCFIPLFYHADGRQRLISERAMSKVKEGCSMEFWDR